MEELKSTFLWHVFPEKLTEYLQLKNDCERVFRFKMVCASNDIENGFKENLRQRKQVLKGIVRKNNDDASDGYEDAELTALPLEISVHHRGENIPVNCHGVQVTKYENTKSLNMKKLKFSEEVDDVSLVKSNEVMEDSGSEESSESGVYFKC